MVFLAGFKSTVNEGQYGFAENYAGWNKTLVWDGLMDPGFFRFLFSFHVAGSKLC